MSLQRLKDVLLPKAMKPVPPEMIPFQPINGEPIKVSDTQVCHGGFCYSSWDISNP